MSGEYGSGRCPNCGGKNLSTTETPGGYMSLTEMSCNDCDSVVTDDAIFNARFGDCRFCGAKWVPAGNNEDGQERHACSECERLVCADCEAKWKRGQSSLENPRMCKQCARRVQFLPLPRVPAYEVEDAA